MNDGTKIDVAVSVMPMRFTSHFQEMSDFLELIGFSARVRRNDSWLTVAGEAGMVALHSTETSATHSTSGRTDLLFAISDADALSTLYSAAGYRDVEIYDEAYGRVLRVRHPDGTELSFDEEADDQYGYEVTEPHPGHGVVSMPIRFDSPTSTIGEILALVGFERLDEGDDAAWRVWSRPEGGSVALHPPGTDHVPGSHQLAFRTREPLGELAARLEAAGYAGVSVSEQYGGELQVTDPDGQSVLIQPR
ncbi:MAG TPA: hypothetical protein VHC49_19345 [Mycobacteriales bacterium]|nr:hypothetical protein [Mycobacteriales bacterium]